MNIDKAIITGVLIGGSIGLCIRYLHNKQPEATVVSNTFSVGHSSISYCTRVTVTEQVSPTKTISYEACKEDVK